MITWKLAKQAAIQNTQALYSALRLKYLFTPYIAANFGSIEARHYGIGHEPK